MKDEKQLESLLSEMNQETIGFRGDEFGLFDYQDLDSEVREQKWFILSYLIDMQKISPKETGLLFQQNPWFTDWYKRTVLSEVPESETYH
jgi:hypothetical protein|tara:strand:- start:105 stop:374 length:270 start_codon:yes stop_codon:yes gene_type:complete